MTDIILEIIRAVIVGILCGYLFFFGKKEHHPSNSGWFSLVCGFSLVFLGMIVDISDNFESLNKFIILGDTPYQAFFEKVVGYLCGFVLIAIGFWKWLPAVNQLSQTKTELHHAFYMTQKQMLDRARIEVELRESENKYRHLYRSAPVGMYEIDFTKNKFTSVNELMCQYSGYSEKEFLSMNPMNLLTENGQGFFLEKLVTGQNTIENTEYNLLTKEGRQLNVILNSDFIYDDERLKGARVVVHDVTERKKMEAVIVQSEKMISIGGLAAGMAHEINNPLAGMMQNAQVIHQRLTKDLPANAHAAREVGTSMEAIAQYMEKRNILTQLENINHSGKRAAKIIENVLSFARKSSSIKGEYHLEKIITETIELAQNDYDLKEKYDVKQIKIKQEFHPETPSVLCEKREIQQVIFNVIKNAAESMHLNKKGPPPRLIIRLYPKNDMACLEIEDNGPGMKKSTLKRIFEPFYTTKGFEEGTGLGLSVSYFIISEMHGGQMDVDSSLSKGTKFIITLPAAQYGKTSAVTQEVSILPRQI